MRTTALSLALIGLGIVLALAVTGVYGEALIVAGFIVLLYKMVRVADSETAGRQAAMDKPADEVRSTYQRRV
jgi:hypothetical protein